VFPGIPLKLQTFITDTQRSMATSNRAALITKAHKVLKKYYKPVAPPQRSILEHALYGCCLENTSYEAADRAFAGLSENFFDWNEVRVCTVGELAEAMGKHPYAEAAAGNIRRILQAVFEDRYQFDLEPLRKENLGKATKKLQDFDGVTPFVLSYVVQAGLGGHSIPIDQAALDLLLVLNIINEAEAAKHTVPGLERAIPKTKGVEFGSLLHQLAAEFMANPNSQAVHKILLQINEEAKDRLPKRGAKPKAEAAPAVKEAAAKEPEAKEPPKEAEAAEKAEKAAKPPKKTAKKKAAPAEKPEKAEKASKADKAEKSEKKKAVREVGTSKKKASTTLAKRKPR